MRQSQAQQSITPRIIGKIRTKTIPASYDTISLFKSGSSIIYVKIDTPFSKERMVLYGTENDFVCFSTRTILQHYDEF